LSRAESWAVNAPSSVGVTEKVRWWTSFAHEYIGQIINDPIIHSRDKPYKASVAVVTTGVSF
jgi:hypothetical protein